MSFPKSKNRITIYHYVLLSCIWIFLAVLVNPIGDFPLNDDWSYGRAVKSLIDNNRLEFSGWTSMPLIAQVLWGSLFCLPFGFSFTALRFSTLILGLLGIFATYGLLKEIKSPPVVAFLGALIVLINPLYFELSFTFMTDVPFFAFAMLSYLFLIRGIRQERSIELIIGAIFAGVATLIRQLGVVIPLSFGIAYLAKNGFKKKALQAVLFQIAWVIGALILFQTWLQCTRGLPARYNIASGRILKSLSNGFSELFLLIFQRAAGGLIYLGVFLLPFLILLIFGFRKSFLKSEILLFIFTFFIMGLIVSIVWKNQLMPLLRNILFDFGLGPPLLRDIYILGLPNLPVAPVGFWFVITIIGVLSGAFLILHLFLSTVHLLRKLKDSLDNKWILILNVMAFFLYFVPIILTGYYDRYLLYFLPILMIILLTAKRPIHLHKGNVHAIFTIVLIIVYGTFSLGATHDYLSWNRSRWIALDYLTKECQVSPKKIDGGFEFNGWYMYNPRYVEQKGKSYWWVENDDYVISFGPIIGYKAIKSFPYKRWIPFGQGKIFILQKKNDSDN